MSKEENKSEFFKELYSLTGKEVPNAKNLSTEHKAALAGHFRNKGWKVKEIAEHLSCSPTYVYNLFKMDTNDLVSELEAKTYLENYIEYKKMLEDEISYHKKVRESLRATYKVQEKQADGTVEEVEKQGSPRDHTEVSRIIAKYQEMLIKLEEKMGTLPISGSKNIYGSLADTNPNAEADVGLKDLNSDELNELLIKKLSGTTASIYQSTLKQLKDETII